MSKYCLPRLYFRGQKRQKKDGKKSMTRKFWDKNFDTLYNKIRRLGIPNLIVNDLDSTAVQFRTLNLVQFKIR